MRARTCARYSKGKELEVNVEVRAGCSRCRIGADISTDIGTGAHPLHTTSWISNLHFFKIFSIIYIE